MLAEGARLAAADGIGVRVFGPPDELGLDGVDGIEVVPTDGVDRQRRGPGAGGPRQARGLGRARRRATSPRARADAMVSPGSTGATMAAATFGLRRLKGVQRPALAVQLPVPGKPVLFLDVGANVEVRAQHLVQFAFLGAAFSDAVLGVERPAASACSRSARRPARAARRWSRRTGCSPARRRIDFAGNVEGRDLPAGDRRRRRHRRLHRQRRPEADGGDGEDGRRRDRRRRPLQPVSPRSAACC